MGLLPGLESAKVDRFSVPADHGAPLARLGAEVGPLIPGAVVPRTTPVRVVLPASRSPQIVPAVVAAITVAMVNLRFAPPAGYVEPRQLMCGVQALVNTNINMASS